MQSNLKKNHEMLFKNSFYNKILISEIYKLSITITIEVVKTDSLKYEEENKRLQTQDNISNL